MQPYATFSAIVKQLILRVIVGTSLLTLGHRMWYFLHYIKHVYGQHYSEEGVRKSTLKDMTYLAKTYDTF